MYRHIACKAQSVDSSVRSSPDTFHDPPATDPVVATFGQGKNNEHGGTLTRGRRDGATADSSLKRSHTLFKYGDRRIVNARVKIRLHTGDLNRQPRLTPLSGAEHAYLTLIGADFLDVLRAVE